MAGIVPARSLRGQRAVTSEAGLDRGVGAVEELIDTEEVGALALEGLLRPVPTFNVGG